MIYSALFFFVVLGQTLALPTSGLQLLFPAESRQYSYVIKTNISCGTMVPVEDSSYWTMDGKLLAKVYDNYTRVRYSFGSLKTSIKNKNHEFVSHHNLDAAKYLKKPWEVEYQENGNINFIYVPPNEPVWATNMKRAISINFQLKKSTGTYYNQEPCLYENYMDCNVMYVATDNTIRKYNTLRILSENSGYTSWVSVPKDYSKAAFLNGLSNMYDGAVDYDGPLDNIGTANRVYELDDKIGLLNFNVKSVFQHRTRSQVLAVSTDISLKYDTDSPTNNIEKLELSKKTVRYSSNSVTDPTNGIRSYSQEQLRNRTYDILIKIATQGIDGDNIVKNASKIHNLDFVHLLREMSQLTYETLNSLYEDMALGTSYEIETARNIFLEVLPHVRTNACALFIKYLVEQQEKKVEHATLLSLIRKLPFNVDNHSQELLEQLEVFTRLGLDFPQEIRHAGILSFATLVFKAAEVRRVKQDYFENTVVKYFRMYSDCPQYKDRLVWLQGLTNLKYSTENYLWTIYLNNTFDPHERFWAIMATTYTSPALFAPTWHILMDENEDIQLRIAALHTFLSSKIRPSELLSIHNYILSCSNNQLKRFWYTTVKSLENSKTYNGYRVASNYATFLTNQVRNPDARYWATGNHIVGAYDDETATGAMLQLMTIGDELTGLPSMVHFRIKTASELMATSDIGIYIKAEGVATNIFQKLHSMSMTDRSVDEIVEILKKMKVQTLDHTKVHIEVVVNIHEKTVYATYFNQSSLDWDGQDLSQSIVDFLKFGSHINQQMVYYPFQLDAKIPTELGTPVRLQTAVVSFSSIRGNLNAPTNDLNIRYRGTAVTSLSTDGPLLQSEHTARVQQSVVGHLPMNFHVSLNPVTKTFELTWPNPGTQDAAGLAMHARTQIVMDSINRGLYTRTIKIKENGNMVDDNGIFFDCRRRLSAAEVIQEVLASGLPSHDFISGLRPSLVLLKVMLFFTAPPSSCGLVAGGRTPGESTLKVRVGVSRAHLAPGDTLRLNVTHSVYYSEYRPDNKLLIKVDGYTALESVEGNVTLNIEANGELPFASDENNRKWKLCIREDFHTHASPIQDTTVDPSSYSGQLTLSLATGVTGVAGVTGVTAGTCPAGGSHFLFRYKGAPRGVGRYLEVSMSGTQLPKLNLSNEGFGTHPVLRQLAMNLEREPLNLTAVIEEKNGVATVSMNSGAAMQIKSDSFAWLLDNWSNMQLLKKFGIYRECRIENSTIHTLIGVEDRLALIQNTESLLLADCTEDPRFAILRSKTGELKMIQSGTQVILSSLENGTRAIYVNGVESECVDSCVYPPNEKFYDIRITKQGESQKIHFMLSGVQLYWKREATVFMLPHSYMHTACGECMRQQYYQI